MNEIYRIKSAAELSKLFGCAVGVSGRSLGASDTFVSEMWDTCDTIFEGSIGVSGFVRVGRWNYHRDWLECLTGKDFKVEVKKKSDLEKILGCCKGRHVPTSTTKRSFSFSELMWDMCGQKFDVVKSDHITSKVRVKTKGGITYSLDFKWIKWAPSKPKVTKVKLRGDKFIKLRASLSKYSVDSIVVRSSSEIDCILDYENKPLPKYSCGSFILDNCQYGSSLDGDCLCGVGPKDVFYLKGGNVFVPAMVDVTVILES